MGGIVHLTFIHDKEDIRWLNAANAARHRHSIFTDVERRDMTLELISSVPDQNPDQAIVDLEIFDSDINCSKPFSLFRGPFGAFRCPESLPLEPLTFGTDDTQPSSGDWFEQLEELQREEDLNQTPFSPDALDADYGNDVMLAGPSQEPLQSIGMDFHEPSLQAELNPYLSVGNIEGWNLLSHYKDRIVPLISPLCLGKETPWMSLVIPCAMETLADLMLNGSPNHARLALLNAVWSTSAFHLGNNSMAYVQQWTLSAARYLARAQYHFQRCMEESCISAAKMSKYKEILMAMLSLSNAFMIKGDPEMRHAYLVQTEKLICIKGLSQPALSANKRALHHCYAYMRIMAETTCIADRFSINQTLNDNTTYGGGFRIYPNLVFSTTTMSMEKDPRIAQHDLHLAIPGRWSSTLFPTLYGIDEIFLMLLSQVIRLANERDLSMMSDAGQSRLSLKEFWTRAKGLERAIDHLLPTANPSYAQPYNGALPVVMTATAHAMYTALSIFFQRRIYEIDPAMLQRNVNAIRGYLIQIQQEEIDQKSSHNAALIWPAFITACEAVSPELQVFFSSWFDNCARTTTLVHASVAKQIFETIWTKRDEVSLSGGTFSWPDILRDGDIKFMCI
ncbi:transcriptional regulator family: Fungal Specific TF [Penicillium psychrosexuale]|uniref:transcriptional regulator family: Fungal Specific TF n=1 Tax=Penicillium psychrosexuale TaxID=1002107 RepID=UPI0025453050|nr:transcriptional regulator family: Fungal Specific TF [Penicillium psychrosexuale]KAJ5795864.1 transcriptional regulator family: Fungal Specific TF [Penicillium psychrosexuale]